MLDLLGRVLLLQEAIEDGYDVAVDLLALFSWSGKV